MATTTKTYTIIDGGTDAGWRIGCDGEVYDHVYRLFEDARTAVADFQRQDAESAEADEPPDPCEALREEIEGAIDDVRVASSGDDPAHLRRILAALRIAAGGG